MSFETLLSEGGWIIEFSYVIVLGGGISTLFCLLFCDVLLFGETPYRDSFGSIRWETVMYNMVIGGVAIYFIICIERLVYGLGDGWTIWIAVVMILLAICMVLFLLSSVKTVTKNKQMMKDFNTWLLERGKTTDEDFNNLVNRAINETNPEMEGRMETAIYQDLKEFAQEQYPDFYSYLVRMEGQAEPGDV